MVKIHGNYCGPNWTAGQAKPASMIDSLPYVAPVDALDAACLEHDRDCAKGGCSAKGDRQLARKALGIALVNPSLRPLALVVAATISAASTRRER